MKNRIALILVLIVLLAGILRFYNLSSTPPSLYWDEVSQGFNSYSVLKTGFDEHHEFFPIARFQAFGDYKAPVYIYLDVAAQFLFGQNEFAVRLPSAFFGTLTVLIAFYLTREIFINQKNKNWISLFAALFLAVSPWHIQLSRAAYEANIATFFTVLALCLFFIAKRKNAFIYILCAISFVLGFYSFNAHRIFIPLMVFLIFLIYRKEILLQWKKVLLAGIIGVVLLISFIIYFRTPESKLRYQEVNIFSDIAVIKESNRLIQNDQNSLIGKIVHNRRVLYSLSYVKHYFDFFDPTYLFFKGDQNPRFSTQDNGELYLYMLPLILIGMYALLKSRGKEKIFVIGWIILAPIAAATARETPHALRSETFIPVYEILAGFGAYLIARRLLKYKKSFVIIGVTFFFIFSYYLLDFLHAYYVHMPQMYSQDWQYGYKQVIEKTEKIKNNYDKIIFSDSYGRAYIYILWYGKYTPQDYWKYGKVNRDVFGFYNVLSFEKYVFEKPNDFKNSKNEKILFVGPHEEIPAGSRTLYSVSFLDGKNAFDVADNL